MLSSVFFIKSFKLFQRRNDFYTVEDVLRSYINVGCTRVDMCISVSSYLVETVKVLFGQRFCFFAWCGAKSVDHLREIAVKEINVLKKALETVA